MINIIIFTEIFLKERKAMTFESIISHMNEHHKENLIDLCKSLNKNPVNVELKSVDFEGLDILCDGEELRINFDEKADESTIKYAIIKLCKDAKKDSGTDFKMDSKIKEEIENFKKSFKSVSLATLSEDKEVLCSYAPFINTEEGNFIYISEVSEHFDSIKANPKNIEVMFLEDECKASSVILRKRLRYKSEASFIQRGEFFDKIYDEFERQTKFASEIKTIRTMLDFHLIKLDFKKGRFVKGFGQAYDIENGEVKHVKSSSKGHPHKHQK